MTRDNGEFQQWIVDRIMNGEVVPCIGQVTEKTKRELDRRAKQGAITKWRGRWFPIAGASFGLGPMKTCYGLPDVAVFVQSISA